MPKTILLTQGRVAVVADEDYEFLNQYKWRYHAHGVGYALGRIDRKSVWMHRVIMCAAPGDEIDHRNGDGLDNRRENLRRATRGQNNANRQIRPHGDSNYKGVYWRAYLRKWQVAIQVNKKQIYLGLFDNEVDAAHAYDAAAREHFGEFARCNFPDPRPSMRVLRAEAVAVAALQAMDQADEPIVGPV